MTLIRRRAETHDTESFFWQPEEPFDYLAGQFLRWTLRHDHPDDRGEKRFFTMSSAPSEPLIMNTTKFNVERSSTFKRRLKELQTGDTIEVSKPSGEFTLPDDKSHPLVWVAGGIGVTPFRSMLKFMLDRNLHYQIHLLYACRTPQDIPYRPDFEEWLKELPKVRITYIVEQPGEGWQGETGRLDGKRIIGLGEVKDQVIYLSGPEPMIKAFESQLLELKLPTEQIKTDFFPGYTQI